MVLQNQLSKNFMIKIRKRRQELGWSQLKLSQLIGYTNNNIGMWEQQGINLFRKFPELEKTLGVTIDILWNGEKI